MWRVTSSQEDFFYLLVRKSYRIYLTHWEPQWSHKKEANPFGWSSRPDTPVGISKENRIESAFEELQIWLYHLRSFMRMKWEEGAKTAVSPLPLSEGPCWERAFRHSHQDTPSLLGNLSQPGEGDSKVKGPGATRSAETGTGTGMEWIINLKTYIFPVAFLYKFIIQNPSNFIFLVHEWNGTILVNWLERTDIPPVRATMILAPVLHKVSACLLSECTE